jgi:hypothetical protein
MTEMPSETESLAVQLVRVRPEYYFLSMTKDADSYSLLRLREPNGGVLV